MGVDKLADVVLKDLGEILKSKSVIGDPIEAAGKTIIPITKVSFGFGIGGSDDRKDNANFGGGSAGGANIEPVSFLIVDEKGVKLLKATYRRELWEKILDMPQAEEIIEKLKKFLEDKLSSEKARRDNNETKKTEEKF